jgi:hypothetical protein
VIVHAVGSRRNRSRGQRSLESAYRLGDVMDDPKSEAETLHAELCVPVCVSAIKGCEKLLALLGIHPDAVIGYVDTQSDSVVRSIATFTKRFVFEGSLYLRSQGAGIHGLLSPARLNRRPSAAESKALAGTALADPGS